MSRDQNKASIGFVGTGVMGKSMAGHLLEAGHPMKVYNRTRSKAEDLIEKGAVWSETAGAAAVDVDVVISIVGFPADVEHCYFGNGGILEKARSGACLIDMTTSSPALAGKIAEAADQRQLSALDAPVSGGDLGAREARLSIMVGGEIKVYERMLPVFEVMGKNIVYQGPAGSGQHTKMANQIAIAAGMIGVCESIAYARRSGLDPKTVLESIGSGAAGSWSLNNLGPRIVSGDFAPGFYVKHFIKDMKIALESADALGLETPGLALAQDLYGRLSDGGGEDLGTQALYQLIEGKAIGG
ncbi:MAG: NAD(P)-dependent oxidoreductase [Verrucomicrobiota bacterium]